MQILKVNWRPGKRLMAESICIITAGHTRPWEWQHRKRCTPASGNIEMKFSFPTLRAGSLRSPARSVGKEGQSKTTTTKPKVPNSFQDLTGLPALPHRPRLRLRTNDPPHLSNNFPILSYT